jgi:hypothetical protein
MKKSLAIFVFCVLALAFAVESEAGLTISGTVKTEDGGCPAQIYVYLYDPNGAYVTSNMFTSCSYRFVLAQWITGPPYKAYIYVPAQSYAVSVSASATVTGPNDGSAKFPNVTVPLPAYTFSGVTLTYTAATGLFTVKGFIQSNRDQFENNLVDVVLYLSFSDYPDPMNPNIGCFGEREVDVSNPVTIGKKYAKIPFELSYTIPYFLDHHGILAFYVQAYWSGTTWPANGKQGIGIYQW